MTCLPGVSTGVRRLVRSVLRAVRLPETKVLRARMSVSWALVVPLLALAACHSPPTAGNSAGGGSAGGSGGSVTDGGGVTGGAAGNPNGSSAGSGGAGGCPASGCSPDGGAPDGGGCLYNGSRFQAGDTFAIGCSSCTCDPRGVAVCSYTPCPDGGSPLFPRACGSGQTCNEDPTISGPNDPYCFPDGTCSCGTGPKSHYTGRCLDVSGDDGSGCEYGGLAYAVGAAVPVLGCGGRCACALPGVTSCPPSACVPCTTGKDYYFSMPSGQAGYFYRPGTGVNLVFPSLSGSDVGRSCTVPFPACDSPGIFDVSDLNADIADADVQRALMAVPAPVYGDRATGAPTFSFRDETGTASSGFSVVVGHECATATPTCDTTPAGVQRLVADITSVVSAALADPLCVNVH